MRNPPFLPIALASFAVTVCLLAPGAGQADATAVRTAASTSAMPLAVPTMIAAAPFDERHRAA